MTAEVMPDDGCDEIDDTSAGGGAAEGQRVLVLLLSACSAEALQSVATAWHGPVLVVGSAEEARSVLNDQAYPVTGEPGPAPGEDSGPAPGEKPSTVRLDPDRQVVTHAGREAALTPLEFGFLAALLGRPGRVRRFEQLTEEVWGTGHIGEVTQVHSLVKRLRRKLKLIGAPVELCAVRGVGFRLDRPGSLHAVEP